MQSKNNQFKIAVIGAGASGLSSAYELTKLGFQVDIYEKSDNLGGLAAVSYTHLTLPTKRIV